MLRKAQAEFALILGIVLIAVFVGVFSLSSIGPPTVKQSAMNDEQKEVASFTADLVRDATSSTISELYRNGGYLDGDTLPLGSVTHPGFGEVAYWQICETTQVPNVEAKLKEGIKKYIDSHLSGSVSFSGKAATFSKSALAVAANVYDNRVTVSVNLPTVYDGASLEQPYRAEVYTNLGRIYSFSGDFALMEGDLRMLDNHLIKSLMQSSETSSCWIPFGVGNAAMRHTITWDELSSCMEQHARYSLSNTQIGREVPLTEDGKISGFDYSGWKGTASEFFFIPALNTYDKITGLATGNSDKYSDLKATFYLGDSDGFDSNEFSAPQALEIKPKVGGFTAYLGGLTVAEYAQSYSVRYPVIVNVWDEKTGESMKFAVYVYMKENGIGTGCISAPALPPSEGTGSENYADRCGTQATEWSTVTVTYDGGSPVANADVYYDGCFLGKTNDLGAVSARIAPAVFSPLSVTVDGNEYTECHGSDTMSNAHVTIPESRDVNFIFKKVPVTKTADGNTYMMSPPLPLSDGELAKVELSRETDICGNAFTYVLSVDSDGETVSASTVRNLPIDEYEVVVTLEKDGSMMGLIDAAAVSISGSDVYVYVPSVEGFDTASDIAAEVDNIKSLYASCGITQAVSVSIQSAGVCQWTKT